MTKTPGIKIVEIYRDVHYTVLSHTVHNLIVWKHFDYDDIVVSRNSPDSYDIVATRYENLKGERLG